MREHQLFKQLYEMRISELKASFKDCEDLIEAQKGIITTSNDPVEILRSQKEIQRLEGLMLECCEQMGEANKKIYLIETNQF